MASDARADSNLERLFAFVDRRAARSRIDEKLTRLEALSPGAFGSLAPRIEAMVDEVLTALPEHRQPSRQPTSMIRLRWAIAALTLVLGLIAVGQWLAARM